MRIIKTYKQGFNLKVGLIQMKKAGWVVEEMEDVKKLNPVKTIGLGLIFLPLALFGSSKKVKVTFKKKEII